MQRQFINTEPKPLQPKKRIEKTLSRAEIQWLINLLDQRIEECQIVKEESETSILEAGLANLMQENYEHLREKLSDTLEHSWTRIYVRQPEKHA